MFPRRFLLSLILTFLSTPSSFGALPEPIEGTSPRVFEAVRNSPAWASLRDKPYLFRDKSHLQTSPDSVAPPIQQVPAVWVEVGIDLTHPGAVLIFGPRLPLLIQGLMLPNDPLGSIRYSGDLEALAVPLSPFNPRYGYRLAHPSGDKGKLEAEIRVNSSATGYDLEAVYPKQGKNQTSQARLKISLVPDWMGRLWIQTPSAHLRFTMTLWGCQVQGWVNPLEFGKSELAIVTAAFGSAIAPQPWRGPYPRRPPRPKQ